MLETSAVPFLQSPDYLLISQATAAAFAVVRLLHFGLRKKFPALFSYLLVIAFGSFVFSVLAIKSRVYYWAYLTTEAATWCVAALAVGEMFALIFRDYPGIRTVGRWALYAALVTSIAGSLAIGELFSANRSMSSSLLFYHQVFDRSISFILAVIVVILMTILSRYPLNLERNTYVASGFFSAIFLEGSAVKLIDSVSKQLAVAVVDRMDVGFTALCFLAWGLMLQPAAAPAPAKPPSSKPREAELLQQLDTMNRILSRSVKK